MPDETKSFGETAVSLAKNPLGIIALFIVLVYGFASLLTLFGDKIESEDRRILVYFLVGFPILVLGIFTWLVIRYPKHLWGPGDFKNEENYLKMQMSVVASLTANATTSQKSDKPPSETDLNKIVEVARSTHVVFTGEDGWRNHVLWVDDNPNNNTFIRKAFEDTGVRITLALSTNEAFEKLSTNKFVSIISDMGRKEGKREGYVLLDKLRNGGDMTPLFFFAGSNDPKDKAETTEHGGQGCTNNGEELFQMVMNVVTVAQQTR